MRDEWSCRQLPSEPHQLAPRSRCCLCSKLINGPNYSHHRPTSNPSCDSIARARYIAIAHSYPLCMGSFVLDWWLGERTNNLEEAPFFLTVDEIGFSSLYSHFKRHIWLLMVSYCLWPPGNQLKVRYYWRKATADRRSYFCYVPAEGVRSPTAYEYIK